MMKIYDGIHWTNGEDVQAIYYDDCIMVIEMVIKMWYVYVILVTLTHMGYRDSANQKIVLSKKSYLSLFRN